jgi:hypothetical protein
MNFNPDLGNMPELEWEHGYKMFWCGRPHSPHPPHFLQPPPSSFVIAKGRVRVRGLDRLRMAGHTNSPCRWPVVDNARRQRVAHALKKPLSFANGKQTVAITLIFVANRCLTPISALLGYLGIRYGSQVTARLDGKHLGVFGAPEDDHLGTSRLLTLVGYEQESDHSSLRR